MNTAMIVAMASAVVLGGGAAAVTMSDAFDGLQTRAVHSGMAGECEHAKPQPYASNQALESGVRVTVIARGGPHQVFVCLIGEDGTVRRAEALGPMTNQSRSLDWAVPAGKALWVDVEFRSSSTQDGQQSQAMGISTSSVGPCAAGTWARITVPIGQAEQPPGTAESRSISASSRSGDDEPCGPPPSQAGLGGNYDPMAPVQGDDGPRTGYVLAGAGLLSVAGVLSVRSPWMRAILVGLFSRVAGAKVLEHEQRARIQQIVAVDPGVHGQQVVERLGASAGATLYHLRVLTRERVLSAVRVGRMHHYFPFGTRSPVQMRRSAAARSPAVARILSALEDQAPLTLSRIAQRTGRSLPNLSRMVRRLETLGLVRTYRNGSGLRVEAVGDSA